ncbi:MAG: hypothetical protein IID31_04565 [Planctomycetes bacterium]|nr:hypothetical protein [Planctomycetota bacterium]
MAVDVVWIFSLPRNGSSVTAYAAAEPFGAAVADEVLGPWDRTGEPYNYPALQRRLIEAYHGSRCILTPEVVALATELFELLGEKSGRVVSKHPHLKPAPAEFRIAFPGCRAVWLMRNPLRRLNSLYNRGWTDDLRPNHELAHFSGFARSWLAQPQRLVFEQMRRDPRRFFRSIYRHWGWDANDADIERAIAYTRDKYHSSSCELDDKRTAAAPLSESRWCLPEEALEMYLADPFVRRLMRRCRYPVGKPAYRVDDSDGTWQRRWYYRVRKLTPPRRVEGPVVDEP